MFTFLKRAVVIVALISLAGTAARLMAEESTSPSVGAANHIELSEEHIAAINRRRRLMLHYDYSGHTMKTSPWGKQNTNELDQVVDFYSHPYQTSSTEFLDTIVYELGEGPAVWPSQIVPRAKVVFPKWWDVGVDPLGTLIDIAKQHKREVFLSYRLNGTDVEEDAEYGNWKLPALKEKHKDWLVKTPWDIYLWNFAYQGVRDHKVAILREVAAMYDVAGLQIDLARSAILFPAGEQWENRDHMTVFMRQLRTALQEVAAERGRPLLIAVRVPENLVGCTFDGMDVTAWIDEGLIDILITGCGASDIDVPAYRRLVEGTHVQIYPSWDRYHPNEGYREPPIAYWRGLYSKWWELGADGVHTFNLSPDSPILAEIGDREGMRYRDKVFIVARRTGSHGDKITGNPNDWQTPRHQYFMTYMQAPLAAMADAEGKADTLLTLMVTDDLKKASNRIDGVSLRLLLSDLAAHDRPAEQRIAPTHMWTYTGHPEMNIPPLQGVEQLIEVRINNLLLPTPHVEGGWLIFEVGPRQVTRGDNLIGVRVAGHPDGHRQNIRIEKVELAIDYREDS